MTTNAAALPFGTFSDPTSTVFWVGRDGTTGNYLGYYTNAANCQSRMFTVGLWVWEPVKDQGLIYGDEVFFDTVGNIDVTLLNRVADQRRVANHRDVDPAAREPDVCAHAPPTFQGWSTPSMPGVTPTVSTCTATCPSRPRRRPRPRCSTPTPVW